jgi:hypothetical protein
MDRKIVLGALAVIAAVLIGIGAYQAGFAQGLAATGEGVRGVYPYAHPGPGFGLGLLFPLLLILLVIALVRSFFWGGGPRWNEPGGPRQRMFDEWHREAHRERPSGGQS